MADPSQRQGGSARAHKPLMLTSRDRGPHFDRGDFDPGHSHTFRPGDARTSVDSGHSHRIVFGRIQKNAIDGHTHTVTGSIDELEDFAPEGGRRPARKRDLFM